METRWLILLNCCIVSFAQDFFYDEPSSLVQRLTGSSVLCWNGTDTFCLKLDMLQFNVFFSGYSWSCAVAALFSGWAVDQFGSKIPLWIATAVFLLGAFLFAVGSYASSTAAAFGWMVTGRVLNGIGAGALVTICHRLKDVWFQSKEIGLAFALHIVSGRLGSAVSYLLIGGVVDMIGLAGCLWIGFLVVFLGCISGVYLGWMEERAHDYGLAKTWKELWQSFIGLDGMFWLFAVAVFFVYGTVSTFTANGAAMMAHLLHYSESTSSYMVGIVYDICLLAPILGYLLDRYGYRDYWITGSTSLLLLGFLIFLIPSCPGWTVSVFVGLCYCIFPPTVWSSLPMIVSPGFFGTSNGLLKFFQYLGVGVMTTIGGAVLDMSDNTADRQGTWMPFIYLLITAATIALVVTGMINWLNIKTAYRLTPSQAKRRSHMDIEEIFPINSKGTWTSPETTVPTATLADQTRD